MTLIREVAEKVGYFDPNRLGTEYFRYIDIASIDRKAKRIVAPVRTAVVSAPSRARQRVEARDVLISTVRPNLNAVAIVPAALSGEMASTGFTVLRARERGLVPEYLFYFSQSPRFIGELSRRATGASYPAVSDDDVLNVRIPFPDYSSQSAIAERLGVADRLCRVHRQAIEMSEGLLSAVFLEMFGDRARPRAECEWTEVTELCESITDCVNKTAPLASEVTPYCMLRTSNVRQGEIDVENVRYVDQATYQRWTRRSTPQWGDVILTREAPLGEVGIVRTHKLVFLGQRLVQYRVDSAKCTPEFLSYGLMSRDVQDQLRKLGNGSTVEHVAVPDCEALIVPNAPLSLQKRFSMIENNFARLKAGHSEVLRQSEHLFQTLLDEAFGEGVA